MGSPKTFSKPLDINAHVDESECLLILNAKSTFKLIVKLILDEIGVTDA